MEQNIFELASRQKLRIKSGNNLVSVEDLWDLSLDALDKVAVSLRKELRSSDESFIVQNKTSTVIELSFTIVKYILDTKIAKRDADKVAREKAQQREKLKDIIAQKQDAALHTMSVEDLQKQLDALS